MKKIKKNKCLCLLLAVVCLMLFTASLTVFSAHADGSTEVTARIETAPSATSQPPAESESRVPEQDISNVSTGEAISAYVVISLLLFIISVLVIYFYSKNNKDKCSESFKETLNKSR